MRFFVSLTCVYSLSKESLLMRTCSPLQTFLSLAEPGSPDLPPPEEEDGSFARGALWGLVLAAVLWAMLLFLVWWL